MRLLIFHGYLLRGTGSNVYNARLAAALAAAGHEVHLISQDPTPQDVPGLDHDAIHHHRPDIGRVLPVYVADRYEGFDARPFVDLDDAEIAAYVDANVTAVREVVAAHQPDAALANHAVMGPAILARGLPADVPYAVKIHGSALEYTVRRDPERFLPYAREGLSRAATVLVGSRHTADVLQEVVGDPELPARTFLGPPGVDVAAFRPRAGDEAAAELAGLARLVEGIGKVGSGAFARDGAQIAAELRRLDVAGPDRHVAFVGKLIVSKGVDLLLAAWPLVLQRVPEARLVVVGFGAYRDALERLRDALASADLDALRALAHAGRAEEQGRRGPLRHLHAVLDGADEAYFEAARALPDRVVVLGRLEHAELAPLLGRCDVQVVPSTFPEAFGMVAAEAAASGAFPVVAAHSGLQEVAAVLAPELPPEQAELLTFPNGDAHALADRVVGALAVAPDARDTLVRVARERFSWEGVATGVVAAATGDHAALTRP